MENTWDVIIAGGGPAGLSTALMLGRARRRTLVIDAGSPRNRFADHMHGVLGNEGASPESLGEKGRAEATGYGVEFVDGAVASVERVERGLLLRTAEGTAHRTRALVVATGITDVLPDVPGLAERWGAGVLHCPYCHGWEVRGKRLGVLTTSPLSIHQAELIRQWSDRVTIFATGLGGLSAEARRRFHARGVRLVEEPVAEVLGEGRGVAGVRMESGDEIALDAIFTTGEPKPHDDFVAALELERAEMPFGSFLAVDQMNRTSDERIWAVGNVVNPGVNVPKSIGDGSLTGAAVNGALVAEDFDLAVSDDVFWPHIAEDGFWEQRYAEAERVWSHAANRVLRDVVGGLEPGRALDVGCGEGADVIWLAQHGWRAVGLDVSATAVARAAAAAAGEGLSEEQAQFTDRRLGEMPDASFDLVTSSFLHSPAGLPREDILREAAAKVARGGHLLITSHVGAPSWVGEDEAMAHAAHQYFLAPQEEFERLGLDPAGWELMIAEARTRKITSPDGAPAAVDDGVLLVRRR